MAKKSMIAREHKRTRTVAKYAEKRAAIKATIADLNVSDDEKWDALVALQKNIKKTSGNRILKA